MIPCDLWILRVCCLHLLLSQWSQRGDFYLTFSTPHPLLSPTLSFTSLLILVSICATIVVFAYPVFSRVCFRASDSVLWPAVTTPWTRGEVVGAHSCFQRFQSTFLSATPLSSTKVRIFEYHRKYPASATDNIKEQQPCLSLTSSPSPTSTSRASASSSAYDHPQTLPPNAQH